MDISTKEGRAVLLARLLATAPAAFSHDLHTAFRAALSLLDEREAEIERLSRERDGLRADLTAGRELMRQAWDIFNAIRARDGAPEGWDHGYWNDLTESLEALLGDVAKPWMTAAAQELIKPIERERDAAQNEAAAHLEEIEHLKAQRDMHAHACDIAQAERDRAQAALRPFADAAKEFGADHHDDSLIWGTVAAAVITAGHLRAARAILSPAPPAEPAPWIAKEVEATREELAAQPQWKQDALRKTAVRPAEPSILDSPVMAPRTDAELAPLRQAMAEYGRAEPYEPTRRPKGSNADEWAVFLEEHRDATGYVAVQIAEAIELAADMSEPAPGEIERLRAAVWAADELGVAVQKWTDYRDQYGSGDGVQEVRAKEALARYWRVTGGAPGTRDGIAALRRTP